MLCTRRLTKTLGGQQTSEDKLKHHSLLFAPVLWLGVAFAESIPLEAVRGQVQLQDLANVASTLGVHFDIFDYEAPEAHCIHFYVEETGPLRERRHDVGGECGLDGPQRLTVQWQLQPSELSFQFFRYRRDINRGGMISGPSIPINEHHKHGTTGYSVPSPHLELGKETLLVHNKYGEGEDTMEVKVFAELRPNPAGTIGTE